MNWEEWEPFYLNIVKQLGLSPREDQEATRILSSLLTHVDTGPLIERLGRTIRDNSVVVCGAGPSLDRHLDVISTARDLENAIYVAVDGAASAFIDTGQKCDIVVTDLDGDLEDIESVMDHGALPIVHAHGDNIDKIKRFVPRVSSILGSTQVKPLHNVFLWGGFTDGDRACYIVSHYTPKRIVLAGMDFGETVGRWSKPDQSMNFPATERKKIKLKIAEDLLSHLWKTTSIQYVVLD
ncbi:MAG: 6-hydroxymethylpterin diphosphokinase MptE-like protein [Candidatus Thorarchaeota archaeon]|jgi:uncharacterized Rossmann fold enzyme